MALLHDLEPKRLWYYFEEISKIPRCSGNEAGVKDFVINFAKINALNYKVDNAGNVVITKDAFPGYENRPGIVLQAHMDMVCEKNSDVKHDFKKEPIRLKVEGNKLMADGTTLGADNGIGISAMLALLEDKNLKHGEVECLFTVEEETGLKGAMELDEDMINAKYMINLDSEEANVIYIGCAGGIESKIFFDIGKAELPDKDWRYYKIKISGLKGGHSGGDINKGRANALKLMARLLFNLRRINSVRLLTVKGGDKHNAIPRECFAEVASSLNDDDMDKFVNNFEKMLKYEYQNIEDQVEISATEVSDVKAKSNISAISIELSNKIIDLMLSIPHGVVKMSNLFDGLVEASTNFAAINIDNSGAEFHMSHRSLVESSLQSIMDVHTALANLGGGKISFSNRYPSWQPDTNSRLLELSSRALKDVYGKEPEIRIIHAGLEAAIIKDKFKGMDIISIGPTIENPHSPMESVDISSVKLFWHSLLRILELIN